MTPTNAPLVGFGRIRVFPLGAITLAVRVGDYPQQIIREVTFLVVNCSSTYNAILGRPTLNLWKAMTSTYYLMIKFPTDYRGGRIARKSNGSVGMLYCHDRDEGSTENDVHRRTKSNN